MRFLRMMLVAAAFSGSAVATSEARLIQTLSYQQLVDRSDLVVIATPVAKTADTAERSELPNIFVQQTNGKDMPVPAVGVETAFATAAVLKGDPSLKRFMLHHYRLNDPRGALLDGPLLLGFDPATSGSYLLFLTRERDGRFAPTGGQTDPALQSILPLPRDAR